MADMFKVVQYWSFERSPRNPAKECIVRIGVTVHFVKQTMFKSQILGGVKDELRVVAKKWCAFASAKVTRALKESSHPAVSKLPVASAGAVEGALPLSGGISPAVDDHSSGAIYKNEVESSPGASLAIASDNDANRRSVYNVANIIILFLALCVIYLINSNRFLSSRLSEIEHTTSHLQKRVDESAVAYSDLLNLLKEEKKGKKVLEEPSSCDESQHQ